MTNLNTLASRVEDASVDDQRELLAEAFCLTHGGESPLSTDYASSYAAKQFAALLNAKAYLDAALTLVPKGLTASVFRYDSGRGRAGVWEDSWNRQDAGHYCHAATPALALCAASLRARSAMRDEK